MQHTQQQSGPRHTLVLCGVLLSTALLHLTHGSNAAETEARGIRVIPLVPSTTQPEDMPGMDEAARILYGKGKAQTQVWIAMTSTHLLYQFRCSEPSLDKRKVSKQKARTRYEDSTSAAIVRTVGKGRIILCGFNIYQDNSNQPPARLGYADSSKRFFRALLASCNVRTGMPHWKLMLPRPVPHQAETRGICLTNNAIFWKRGCPKLYANGDVGASYTYDTFPDSCPDSAKEGWITCAQGILTDRVRNFTQRKTPQQAIVAWKTPQPVTIWFDLQTPRAIDRVVFYVGGTVPACSLYAGTEREAMKEIARSSAHGTIHGITRVSLKPTMDTHAQFLKVVFVARKPGTVLELAEAEIWEK